MILISHSIDYRYNAGAADSYWRAAITNAAYCINRKGAGYDLESDPEPEHAFEILTLRLIKSWIQSVSNS